MAKPVVSRVELAQRLAVLALPLRHLLHDCFQLALEGFEVMLDLLARFFGSSSNSSGVSTLPSRFGANARPVGVRKG